MLISGAVETDQKSLSDRQKTHLTELQKTNTANFLLFKEHVAVNGCLPRQTMPKNERKKLSEAEEAEFQKEVRAAMWMYRVWHAVKENSFYVYAISWESPEQKQEFITLFKETPTYAQKKKAEKNASKKRRNLPTMRIKM